MSKSYCQENRWLMSSWFTRYCLAAAFLAMMVTACYKLPTPVATTVNPETFPQPIPKDVTRVPENPPPFVTANQTFVVIDVQSLPDLVLTSGQVRWQPAFPAQGQAVEFYITVHNGGDQTATGGVLRQQFRQFHGGGIVRGRTDFVARKQIPNGGRKAADQGRTSSEISP